MGFYCGSLRYDIVVCGDCSCGNGKEVRMKNERTRTMAPISQKLPKAIRSLQINSRALRFARTRNARVRIRNSKGEHNQVDRGLRDGKLRGL